MSKIEFNPRKRRHVDYLHTLIMELHTEIFQSAFLVVKSSTVANTAFRRELQTKIDLYKKYSRRLKILEL